MFTDAYKTMLRKVASDYDAASQELFAIARRIEGSDRYNPENELYINLLFTGMFFISSSVSQ